MKKLVGALGTAGVVLTLLVGPSATQQAVSAGVPKVAVSGTPAVGSDLEAVPATWGTTPDVRTYEWLRDGEGDVLSRAQDYVPSEADLGHTLVVVERVRFGATQDESSSTPVAIAGAAAPTAAPAPAPAPAIVPAVNQRRPTIKGTAKVGKKLSVRSKGRWVAPGHRFTYQWLRNGKPIKKASKTSYRLTTKDRRTKITLRVSAQRAGYPTVTARSSASKKVR
ncbi:hypothetical protein [Aeromicrobium sp. Root472D3]|uniref:hypothetical protein n=1 Tax=Aeromicrobium sp. Root472D3 TaxID=1736540 RepID=UPI0006FFB96A|nr:hypothetical protein [Aeromicrobium sp. Root472D3]KQX74920.1 hypothetical protein ASD10_06830 [Aeromicrobium sp. Root472D3]